MENLFRLLVIEDDNEEIENLKDNLIIFNKNQSLAFEGTYKKNHKEGIDFINSNKIDGIMLDLRLTNSTEEAEGNIILREILGKVRVPVVIFSGFIEDLDPKIEKEIEGNKLIKCFQRGDVDYEEIFLFFTEIYNTKLLDILGEDGKLINELNKIFWNRISKEIDHWKGDSIKHENIDRMITRYIISNLKEALEISSDGDFEVFHSSEVYIIPPIKSKLFTGDILFKGKDKYIVLMPPCDLANQGKVSHAVIGKIEEINFSIVKNCKKKIKLDKDIQKNEAIIKRLLSNTYSNNYHCLPPTHNFEGGFIDFRKINSVKIKNINEEYERYGTVSSEFVRDIISRFSQYYSRQGQPSIDTNDIFDKIVNS